MATSKPRRESSMAMTRPMRLAAPVTRTRGRLDISFYDTLVRDVVLRLAERRLSRRIRYQTYRWRSRRARAACYMWQLTDKAEWDDLWRWSKGPTSRGSFGWR